MSVQAVFIVDKGENTLIFLDYLEPSIKINQKELSNILGKLVNTSNDLKPNSFSNFEIKEKCFFFGVFDRFLLIVQHQEGKVPPEDFLNELHSSFIKGFKNVLENYTNSDLSKFRSFTKNVRELKSKYFQHLKGQEIDIGNKPIIDPIKRDYYPEKPSVYKRDDILYNEAKLIKQKYATEFVDGFIFKLQIYINISPTQWFKFFINFSDYPLKPTIRIDEVVIKELGKNLQDLLYFYTTWDKKRPPHMIELVRELETILVQYYSEGRLTKIPLIPKNRKPKVKPLPNIE